MTDKELEKSLRRINRIANIFYAIVAILFMAFAITIIIIVCSRQ